MLPKPTVALNDPDISNMLGRKCSASPLVFRLTEPLACEIFMLAREAVARRRWQGGQQVFFFFLLDSAAEVIVREGGRGRPSGFAAAGPMGHHQGQRRGLLDLLSGVLVRSQARPQARRFIPAQWASAAEPTG